MIIRLIISPFIFICALSFLGCSNPDSTKTVSNSKSEIVASSALVSSKSDPRSVSVELTHLEHITQMADQHRNLLIGSSDAFDKSPLLKGLYKDSLAASFKKANDYAIKFDYTTQLGETIIADKSSRNRKIEQLLQVTLPFLAHSYHVKGPSEKPNPYYGNVETKTNLFRLLDYLYQGGVNEEVWSEYQLCKILKKQKVKRPEGVADITGLSLRKGGYSQTIFLMSKELEEEGLLDRYVAVLQKFGVDILERQRLLSIQKHFTREEDVHHFSSDEFRIVMDTYFYWVLLGSNEGNSDENLKRLANIINRSIGITDAGFRDTVKPDGLGFHHSGVYLSAYTGGFLPEAAMAAYMLKPTGLLKDEAWKAIKLCAMTTRIASQKYDIHHGVKGRMPLANSSVIGAMSAMAYFGSEDVFSDVECRGALLRLWDEPYLKRAGKMGSILNGSRGKPLRPMGLFEMIESISAGGGTPEVSPNGSWAKNYSAYYIHRRDNWMVSLKGFSKYVWDYESAFPSQNAFGQQFSHGVLEILSKGAPVNERDSGFNLANGWDWYHMPAATTVHFDVNKFESGKWVTQKRKEALSGSSHPLDKQGIHRRFNQQAFVGGLTLGDDGMFAMDFEDVSFIEQTDLGARKSYFFSDNLIVCLGTDINGGTSSDEVHTTLFQNFIGDYESVALRINSKLGKSAALLKDNVGNSYYIPNSKQLVFNESEQSSWSDTFKQKTKGRYVSAWLNHNVKPVDASYVYAILVDDSKGDIGKLESDPSSYYKVLDRNNGLHIVEFPKRNTTNYAFYNIEARSTEMIQSVTHQSMIVAKKNAAGVSLSLCVPDFGWLAEGELNDFNRAAYELGVAENEKHDFHMTVKGEWKLFNDNDSTGVNAVLDNKGNTIVSLVCEGAQQYQVSLVPAE